MLERIALGQPCLVLISSIIKPLQVVYTVSGPQRVSQHFREHCMYIEKSVMCIYMCMWQPGDGKTAGCPFTSALQTPGRLFYSKLGGDSILNFFSLQDTVDNYRVSLAS